MWSACSALSSRRRSARRPARPRSGGPRGFVPGVPGPRGPTGPGKPPRREMIEGRRPPDAGRITILGLDAVRQRRRVQERIGVQLQAQALWPDLTVSETLRLFASLYPRRVPLPPILERFALADK